MTRHQRTACTLLVSKPLLSVSPCSSDARLSTQRLRVFRFSTSSELFFHDLLLHAEGPATDGGSFRRAPQRDRKGNSPTSLLAAAQKRAIAIQHALPPPSNAAPLPLHLGNVIGVPRTPRRRGRRHRRPAPALKPAQRTREAAEVVGSLVGRHGAGQHAADGDHGRGVRAHQQRGWRRRVRIRRRDDRAQRVRDPRVQRRDRLAVDGWDHHGCVGAVEEAREVRFERV